MPAFRAAHIYNSVRLQSMRNYPSKLINAAWLPAQAIGKRTQSRGGCAAKLQRLPQHGQQLPLCNRLGDGRQLRRQTLEEHVLLHRILHLPNPPTMTPSDCLTGKTSDAAASPAVTTDIERLPWHKLYSSVSHIATGVSEGTDTLAGIAVPCGYKQALTHATRSSSKWTLRLIEGRLPDMLSQRSCHV